MKTCHIEPSVSTDTHWLQLARTQHHVTFVKVFHGIGLHGLYSVRMRLLLCDYPTVRGNRVHSLEGNPRPYEGAYDIGCFEYVGKIE
jgi:hypothetical protein